MVVRGQERWARLEGRVEGHAQSMTDVVNAVRHLESRMELRFAELHRTIGDVDAKLDSRFLWAIGIQFAGFFAIIAAFLSA